MRKSKSIKLTDYKTTVGDIDKFRKNLREALHPYIFSIDSMEDLYYAALKAIHPVNHNVRKEQQSIFKYIEEVLKYFKLGTKNVRVTMYADNGNTKENLSKNTNSIELFQIYILGVNKLPKTELNKLLFIVKHDLGEVNNLIQYYEETTIVKQFLYKQERPRNHVDRTILDFYLRSLKLQQKALDYYLNGVYSRALENSFEDKYWGWLKNMWVELTDYPYKFSNGIRPINLDYRNIDCSSHRIESIYLGEEEFYQKLYTKNKRLFYKKIFKIKKPSEIFDDIYYNLTLLPVSPERYLIFKELQRLFKTRKWLSFYALALPQVEGFFTEMIKSSAPSANISGALPDKVEKVRPDYLLSDTYFDYYQYVLPEQRNRFSHIGFTDGYMLRSFDMLTDLDHVLRIFSSLENPLINLKRLVKHQDQQYFSNYFAFNHYFWLLNQLPEEHKADTDLRQEIKSFNEFLRNYCSLEYIIQEASRELEPLNKSMQETMESLFAKFNTPWKWHALNKEKLIKMMKENTFQEDALNCFLVNSEKVDRIVAINEFFESLTKYLFSEIPNSLENCFKEVEANKKFVNWVSQFAGLCNYEIKTRGELSFK